MTNKTKDEKPAVNLNTNQVPPKRINRFGLLFREKWPEYIIEIIVIILSITVSFALNEWKENNSKYELEQVYLKSLYHDINSDIEALHEVIEETELVIHKGHVLLDLSKQSNWSELNYGQFITDL